MKISVITISFNSEATMGKTIESIRGQNYSDIEHIVVDGGSSDRTLDIIQDNENITSKWISEPDDGIYDAMNKGIRLATGDVIGFLNSDDRYYDEYVVQNIADAFIKYDCDCTYGNLVYSNDQGKITRVWDSRSYEPGLFRKSWTPAHPTFYCKQSVYEQYDLYKTDYEIAADVELMFRYLNVHGIRSHFIDRRLVNMLEGGVSNQGLQSTITITKEMSRAFKENGLKLNIPKYLFYKGLKMKEFLNR
ncbi:glycosyltransferase family 2 protein [Balneola sp. MJW-20]|uniref:glycosyltransferase family 2 protein n=1 Tax=Gracilimonas aurantiaca TaxID=3234185 RepID=UPI003465C683